MTEPISIPHLLESTSHKVLVVEVDDERIGIPASSVERIVQLDEERLQRIDRSGTLILDDRPIKGLMLRQFLGRGRSTFGFERGLPAPILDIENESVAVVVDGLLDVRHGVTIDRMGELSERFLGRCRLRDDSPIPVVDPLAVAASVRSRAAGSKQQTSKVMIIDDSRATRMALTRLVRTTDAEVTAAASLDEALKACELSGGVPDLVLLDAELEGLQAGAGTAVLRCTPGFERVPIVVLALRDAADHRRSLLDFGATEILLKPFSVETLLQLIRRFADPSENIW